MKAIFKRLYIFTFSHCWWPFPTLRRQLLIMINAENKVDAELKTALHNIIQAHTAQGYNWNHFQNTDKRPDDKVWDMYFNCDFTFGTHQDAGGSANSECILYNREHSFPREWFGGQEEPMNSDRFHIYLTDKYVNAEREFILLVRLLY